MDAQTRDRLLRLSGVLETEERRRPYPGQRYKHGWIPVVAAALGLGSKKDAGNANAQRGPGPRPALATATTAEDIASAAAAEAQRITGRDLHVDFRGSDPQIAREHAEAILQGFERFPAARLGSVLMGDLPPGVLAERVRGHVGGDSIVFSRSAQSKGPAAYRARLQRDRRVGHSVTSTPEGVAMHEFGHVVAAQAGANRPGGQMALAYATERSRRNPEKTIAKLISRYAASSDLELMAEAFADVMINKTTAGELSQRLFGLIAPTR